MDRDITMDIKMGAKSFEGLRELSRGNSIDEADIIDLCEFVDRRYDCADFRLITILRVLYDYKDLISLETLERMENTVLNFKYWMDEPGEDSMCYWSENHQILFFASQYLAGQYAPNKKFLNSGLLGAEMVEIAKKRILRWLKHRFTYGFIEWHSNTYYEEDIAPLCNLIDFAKDNEIIEKSEIIMDFILIDMAMHSYKGLFSATSGRCYEEQKKYPLKQDTLEIGEKIWNYGHIKNYDFKRITSSFHLIKNYRVPKIIEQIGKDEEESIIKTSMGLNLTEVANELGDLMDIENVGYFLWAMEAFSNPESVKTTMKMFREFKMQKNDFLKGLKGFDKKWLAAALPFITKLLNPVTNGVAIQRANTYTYKTKDYMLSTAQKYHPGSFGDQQHIWQATLSDEVTVFTTHPSSAFFEDNARNFSPSYWVGNGILPHSVQDKNVHMSIYKVDQRKGYLEGKRQDFTHAYFPQELMDEVILKGRYVFGKLGEVMISLIGKNQLDVNSEDSSDIIQEGKLTYWICEISTEFVSLDDFISEILSRKVSFKNLTLTYEGKSKYQLKYKGEFKIDETAISTDYERLESPYGNVVRNPEDMTFNYKNQKLYVHFEKRIREEG
ncbi:MAG: hypothetical protein LR001_03495 [Clostridiales bacterium]|nr:hypothetical protein [Clostridiales bacterium]